MKSVSVLSATVVDDKIHVIKELTDDDGNVSLNLHVFSKETLEWRAAEYDISDLDQLVDLILYEPFVNDAQVFELSPDDVPAGRQRYLSAIGKIKSDLTPIVKSTRAKLPDGFVIMPKGETDVYDLIKNESYFDPMALDLKRQHVEAMLDLKRRLLMANSATQQPDRIEALKGRLQSNKKES